VRLAPPPEAAQPRAADNTLLPVIAAKRAEEARHVHVLPSSSAAPSVEPEQFGVLKITADPRALVEVSGPHFHQLGQSPIVGLRVPVGRYQIVFRNDTFGAPLSAPVMILSGLNRSVHADFRQAEPAVDVR
jgi:hypothetical protein